jgi:CO dehydrogenase nickel-insertion accessory protein CooC1
MKLDLLGVINIDDDIYEMDIDGKSIFDIPKNSLSLKQAEEIIEKLKL